MALAKTERDSSSSKLAVCDARPPMTWPLELYQWYRAVEGASRGAGRLTRYCSSNSHSASSLTRALRPLGQSLPPPPRPLLRCKVRDAPSNDRGRRAPCSLSGPIAQPLGIFTPMIQLHSPFLMTNLSLSVPQTVVCPRQPSLDMGDGVTRPVAIGGAEAVYVALGTSKRGTNRFSSPG